MNGTVRDRVADSRGVRWDSDLHRYTPKVPVLGRRAILQSLAAIGLAAAVPSVADADLDPVAWDPIAHRYTDITAPVTQAFYPANYGAAFNGTADDSIAVQAAINAASAAGGGIVEIPSDVTTAWANTLILASNVVVHVNAGSTVKWTGASNGVLVQAGANGPIIRSGFYGDMARIDCNFKLLHVFELHSVQACRFGGFDVFDGSVTTIVYLIAADSPSTIGGYGSTPVRSVLWNDFGRILVSGTCGIGYQLRGLDSGSVVSLNRFSDIELTDCRNIGIRLVSYADNNVFDGWTRISLTADNTVGVVLNDSPSDGIVNTAISNAGSGYTSAPAVGFSGGGGTGAAAFSTVAGGVVTGVFITNTGSGYATPPTIAFTGGGGSNAAATCTLGGQNVQVDVQSNLFGHLAIDTLAGNAGRKALLINATKMNRVSAFHNTPAAEGGVVVDAYNSTYLVEVTGQNNFWNDVRVNGGRVGAGLGNDLAMLTGRGKTSFLLSSIFGGTVSTTMGSNIVSGTGTRFLQDLGVGDRITIGGVTDVITGIASETGLTTANNWGSNLSAQDATIDKAVFRLDKSDGGRTVVVDSRGFIGILRDPGTNAFEVDGVVATAFFGPVGIGGAPDSTVASLKAIANSATVAAIATAQAGAGPSVAVDKYVELTETTDPGAPAAEKGRLYVRDNGADKSQLVVVFPSGAVQVIATEP